MFATARNKSVLSDLEEKGIETLDLTVDDPNSVTACRNEVVKLLGEGRGLNYLYNNA